VLVFSWTRRRPKPGPAPVSVIVRDPHEQLRQAREMVNNNDPRVFYDTLLRALQDYLISRLGLVPAQLNLANVRFRLAERQVPESHIQTLLGLWQTCEQALFAGQTQTTNPQATWQTAENLIQDLERDLHK